MPELAADELLGPSKDRFRLLSGDVRVVETSLGSATFEALREAHGTPPPAGAGTWFWSWRVRRTYSQQELAGAELIHLIIYGVFEPPGEDCGTEYEETTACPHCGAGRIQRSPLSLDVRSAQPDRDIDTTVLRRGKDVAKSIAEEVVVSDRFAGWYASVGGRGARFDQVLTCKTHKPSEVWSQLIVTGPPVDAVPPTRYGIHPFDPDQAGEYRCPLGHVAGLNILSEVTVSRETWDGSDITCTRQLIGWRVGDLVPAPQYLISPSLYRLMREGGARGVRYEIAHLA
jgi:hypothetical protein